ncbi:MAG: hypothetical protein ABSH44_18545 [Bryobacteraceae bacterium]
MKLRSLADRVKIRAGGGQERAGALVGKVAALAAGQARRCFSEPPLLH